MAPVDHCRHRSNRAFEHRLDVTVTQVPHPTGDTQARRLRAARVTEEDTLHASMYHDAPPHDAVNAAGRAHKSAVASESNEANRSCAAARRVGMCSVGTETGE